ADESGRSARWPLFVDPTGSAEYLGTVIPDPGIVSDLPVFHWFVADTAAADTGAGTRASLYYDGELYDNIFVRIRGGTARSYPKKSYKFDFNKGHWFRFAPDQQRVSEINVNSTWPDKAYVRQVLSFETFRDAGVPYSETFPVRLEQNGQFFSVAIFIEQVDQWYLERQGLDPAGGLYKILGGGLRGSVANGVEKKIPRDGNYSDLEDLYEGLYLSGSARPRYIFDNLDIAEVINYYASIVIVHDGDHVMKNFYMHRDTEGTGLWSVLPWDKDLTFGRHWMGGEGVLNDDIAYSTDPINDWYMSNMLADAIMRIPSTREMYLRRVRTLTDDLLQSPATPQAQLKLEARLDELIAQIGDDVLLDAARWRPYTYGSDQSIHTAAGFLKSGYLAPRRVFLDGHWRVPA
ncbi:hypothetical protein LCGC14_2821650, partial [marine sediment metagenome]